MSHKFSKLLKAGILPAGLLGAAYTFYIEPSQLQIEKVSLKLRRLTPAFHGFKIAHISDIHMGKWMNTERLQQIADRITAQKVDVLLITGDFLPSHGLLPEPQRKHLRDLHDVLTPLARRIPSFAVLGNHDYWTNPFEVRQMLKESGITDVTNTVHSLTLNSEKLHICGVDDVWSGDVRLDKVLEKLQDDFPAILLAHEPDYADISAETGRFDLQVSGHTHGGQVVVPFLGPPVLPYLGEKYPSGLYRVQDMYQYTTRGVGMNKLPVRFNCPREITVFTLFECN